MWSIGRGLIKGFVEKRTRDKLAILGTNFCPTLLKRIRPVSVQTKGFCKVQFYNRGVVCVFFFSRKLIFGRW